MSLRNGRSVTRPQNPWRPHLPRKRAPSRPIRQHADAEGTGQRPGRWTRPLHSFHGRWSSSLRTAPFFLPEPPASKDSGRRAWSAQKTRLFTSRGREGSEAAQSGCRASKGSGDRALDSGSALTTSFGFSESQHARPSPANASRRRPRPRSGRRALPGPGAAATCTGSWWGSGTCTCTRRTAACARSPGSAARPGSAAPRATSSGTPAPRGTASPAGC